MNHLSRWKTVQTALLTLFAFPVAAVALAGVFNPSFRSPVFASLMTEIPWSGFGHVIPGALALGLGGLLLSRRIRQRYLWLHKTLGWSYVCCVMLSSIASHVGNYASPSGRSAKLAFLTLGILWPLVTLAGTPLSQQFDQQTHGKLMKVSFALTFAAVNLRIYLAAMLMMGIRFQTAYPIAAWSAMTGNLLAVLLVFRIQAIRRQRKLNELLTHH
jgi:nitrate reductase NapE component